MMRIGIGLIVALLLAYACGIVTTLVAESASPGLMFLRAFSIEEADKGPRAVGVTRI